MNTQLLTAALAAFTPEEVQNYISTRQVQLQKFFLARFLPPTASTDADIRDGNIRILAGIGGVTAPDSPYAKVAGAKVQSMEGSTIKLTAETTVTERDQKIMSSKAVNALLAGNQQGAVQAVQQYLSRLFEDGLMLSLDHAQEQFRAIALATGEIKGDFGGLEVNVDFGVEAKFRVPARTAGNAYGAASSKFWDDVQLARDTLLGGEPQFITDPRTAAAIINNPANGVLLVGRNVVTDWLTVYTLTQGVKQADGSYDTSRRTVDVRKEVTLWVYGGYAEAVDGTRVQFWPEGHMTALLPGSQRVDVIDGQVVEGALGVTHIGPTWELGGQSRRYGKMFRPEGAEYEVQMKAAENVLPHLRETRRAMFFKTALPAQ